MLPGTVMVLGSFFCGVCGQKPMIKTEVKTLFKNKLLLLVLVAIILIPVIYAGLFVDSIMDPYGHVSHLPFLLRRR